MPKIHQIAHKVIQGRVVEQRPLVQKQVEESAKKKQIATLTDEQAAIARDNLADFCNATNPFELENWQRFICDRLQRLRCETGQRIAIHAPPQLGKSIITSQRFPAWLLGAAPNHRVRLLCYNQNHSGRFSVVNQQIMRSAVYKQIFPDDDCRLPRVCRADEWSTLSRRRLLDGQASFLALGWGSGFVGQGVDTLIVDDPYKNREEAYSDTIRTGISLAWKDTIVSRLNPQTNIVLMFHRWKEDDLAGELIEEGGWEQIRFPALADSGPFDYSGRAEGETLSARYPAEYYKKIEKTNPFGFLALYQGTPIAPGGNMCKEFWLPRVAAAPVEGMTYVRYWDKAGTEGGGKYTAGVLMGRDRLGIFYVLDVVRKQLGAVNREAQIRATAARDKATYGNVVQIWIEQEPGSGGMESAENSIRMLAGYPVQAEKVGKQEGDKIARFTPFCDQARAANVRVLERDWTNDYITELCKFPAGKYADQVDASSGALNKLSEVRQWSSA